MKKNKGTRLGRSAAFSKTLIAVLVLAFAGQLASAGVPTTTIVSPLPSRFVGPVILSTESKTGPYSVSLISDGAEQPKVNETRNSNSKRAAARKLISRVKFLSGAKGVKSRKHATPDCQGCKDDCLVWSLECIALSMLGGCGPCAAICLAEQIRCQLKCPCAQMESSSN